jgi:hypothetical protein
MKVSQTFKTFMVYLIMFLNNIYSFLESDNSEDDEFNQKVKDEKERIGNDNNENTKTGF